MVHMMKIRFSIFSLVLFAVFIIQGTGNAQIVDLVAINKNFQKQLLSLLQHHSVLTDAELGLNDLQKKEISKLFAQLSGERRRKTADFADLPRMRLKEMAESLEKELHELSIEYTRKLTEALTPEQDARLLQLCLWKMTGNYVLMFQNTSVQELLQLREVTIEKIEKRLQEFSRSNRELLKERTDRHLSEIMSLFSEEQREQIEQASSGDQRALNVRDFVSVHFGAGFYNSVDGHEICRSHPKVKELKKKVLELHEEVANTEEPERLASLKQQGAKYMSETFSVTLRAEIGDIRYSKIRWSYLELAASPQLLAANAPNDELASELDLMESQLRAIKAAHSQFKEQLAEECEAMNDQQFEEIFGLMDSGEKEMYSRLFGERPEFDFRVWSIVSGGY